MGHSSSTKRDPARRLRPKLLSLLLGIDAAAHLIPHALATQTVATRPTCWRKNEASRLRRHPPLSF